MNFWLKPLIVLILFLIILYVFQVVMSKLLKVENKSFFSFKSPVLVNEQHKKIDRIIRFTFVSIFLLGLMIFLMRVPIPDILFLQPYFLIFLFVVVSESVRAFIEWKYASNRNDYIFTISQLLFMSVVVLLIFSTNIFGWLE